MSGIFGIFCRDDAPVVPARLEVMRAALAEWARDGSGVWLEGAVGLGQAHAFSTPEACHECLPRRDAVSGVVFTAAGRVDNRGELGNVLRISQSELAPLPDSELLVRAYHHWGQECPVHIHGDWAFVAWHPAERRLFLARDHHGNTALYYYADPRVFVFSSSRRALLALNLAPPELDELYLAQVLISWTAYHGERTIHRPLRRLPPAHCLTVTPDRLDVRQYWRLEDTPELRLRDRTDYVAGLREVFDEAVRARLRAVGSVATTLSGGLDSGAVTATAASLLREAGQCLTAFTSVPCANTTVYVGKRFGDELPLARATARFSGNVDLRPIAATDLTPIQAIRRALRILDEPAHAAGNYFWLLDLEQAARDAGCRVLLTGQMGNAGISWTGDWLSQPLEFQLRHLGAPTWAKERIKGVAPTALLAAWRRRRALRDREWYRSSAIHPDFARHLRLRDQYLNDTDEPPRTPREQRYRILLPGRSFVGGLHAELGAAHGLDVRDPTADTRVLAFTFSVPDRIFMDPDTGLDRWLLREAMVGRLPDDVRLNRRRGRQAGDLVPRLRACATEVENALAELAHGPAAEYVDVPYMRTVWALIQTQDTPEAFHRTFCVLTRGIMAGLFVNDRETRSQV